MRVISDTQIVQGFYGWHVWSVNRKAYIPNLLNNNKKTPKLFQPLFCLIVLSFVFMHTCFIGVEILAPQMANWTKRKKKKKNKVINYFFFLFVELPFVSMHPLPQLMRKPRAEGRWSWDKRPSVQGSTSAFFCYSWNSLSPSELSEIKTKSILIQPQYIIHLSPILHCFFCDNKHQTGVKVMVRTRIWFL